MNWWIVVTAALATVIAVLRIWRRLDKRAEEAACQLLLQLSANSPQGEFSPAMVRDLPEPARRFFNYVIRPGATLHHSATIEMTGQLGLGDVSDPNYRPMSAQQILAPPYGLVWRAKSGMLAGSDCGTPSSSWTRFWLLGLLPVVRAANDPDHRLCAFGRTIADGLIWLPATLLPSDNVQWSSEGENHARVCVSFGAWKQSVDLFIAQDGRPKHVEFQRWSNVNDKNEYRYQPFGGMLAEFREFDGYQLPTRVEAGNHYGTADYFPFFKASISAIRFPESPAVRPRG